MDRRPALALLALVAVSGTAAAAESSPEAAVSRYLKAERDFDVTALNAVLAPGFVEVSPRGQVDEHDAVLSFYAPEKKMQAPPSSVSALKARTSGDVSAVTGEIVFTLAPGREMRLSLGATAVRSADGWRLLSAQYTGVPPSPPVAPAPPKAPVPPKPPVSG
ncbi:nuclear transport factor 2 family protein [Luteibacter anthropi]|uniref:nuclear transport factor 2 family protein n=1 Tax=Luteibacter anthropi TaxID=564369 RepID=UPI0020329B0E|nr:nuclear transport factor 2 family protein [Luteibacter anthropi]URX60902.1 nuclear transport factor 2 family protein [Luteibacter anthropi]